MNLRKTLAALTMGAALMSAGMVAPVVAAPADNPAPADTTAPAPPAAPAEKPAPAPKPTPANPNKGADKDAKFEQRYDLRVKPYFHDGNNADVIKGRIDGQYVHKNRTESINVHLYRRDLMGNFTERVTQATSKVSYGYDKTKYWEFVLKNFTLEDTKDYQVVVYAVVDGKNKLVVQREFTALRNGVQEPVEMRELHRKSGADRVATSLAAWESLNSKTALIAGYHGEIDVVAAAPMAKVYDTGVIYTHADHMSAATLKSLKAKKVKSVTIIGGEKSVTPAVEKQLKAEGISVDRVGGKDRYETAVKIAEGLVAEYLFKGNSPFLPIYLATGSTYADALTAGPVAARNEGVVLLTSPEGLTKEAKEFIGGRSVAYLAIGGTAKREMGAAGKNMSALEGKDRYETAAVVYERFFSGMNTAFVATGELAADAVVAGPLAAGVKAGVLLTPRDYVPAQVKHALRNAETVVVVGGINAVSTVAAKQLAAKPAE